MYSNETGLGRESFFPKFVGRQISRVGGSPRSSQWDMSLFYLLNPNKYLFRGTITDCTRINPYIAPEGWISSLGWKTDGRIVGELARSLRVNTTGDACMYVFASEPTMPCHRCFHDRQQNFLRRFPVRWLTATREKTQVSRFWNSTLPKATVPIPPQ